MDSRMKRFFAILTFILVMGLIYAGVFTLALGLMFGASITIWKIAIVVIASILLLKPSFAFWKYNMNSVEVRKIRCFAIFKAIPGVGFGIRFPNFPDCFSGGNIDSFGVDFDITLQKATEALGLHICKMEDKNEWIPGSDRLNSHLLIDLLDSIPKTNEGEIVVPITVYPDIVRDMMHKQQK